MSSIFTGERMTNGIVELQPRSLIDLAKSGGLGFLYGILTVRAEHLCRYDFVIRSGIVEGKKVLDVACGEGYGLSMMAKDAQRRVGVDISISPLKEAKKQCGNNIGLVAADGQHLPIAPDSFDVVVSFETIEHVEDPEVFLAETVRVLKEDGVLVISTPNRDIHSPGREKPANPFHKKEFSLAEFKKLLEKYFGEVEVYGQEKISGEDKSRWVRRIKNILNLIRLRKLADVKPLDSCGEASYFVAVCKNKLPHN